MPIRSWERKGVGFLSMFWKQIGIQLYYSWPPLEVKRFALEFTITDTKWITLTSSPINIAVNILLLTVIFSLLCFTKEMKMFHRLWNKNKLGLKKGNSIVLYSVFLLPPSFNVQWKCTHHNKVTISLWSELTSELDHRQVSKWWIIPVFFCAYRYRYCKLKWSSG